MSTPPNPLSPGEPQLAAELTAGPQSEPAPQSQILPASANTLENPPWTFLDVFLVTVFAFIEMYVVFPMAAMVFFGTSHIFGYRFAELINNRKQLENFFYDPRVILPVQLLGYLVLLVLMVWIVRARSGISKGFFESVRWHWPRNTWLAFVVGGAVLAVLVQVASSRLPIPPSLPMDKFFQTTTYAYLMSAFGILVAPFMEELFFRGFLYPVLARGLGIAASVVLTGLFFMLVHGAQLAFSWAAMLMLLIVGIVLTLVRARTQSLAASVLIHISYNTTIFVTVFVATGGFRHLERL